MKHSDDVSTPQRRSLSSCSRFVWLSNCRWTVLKAHHVGLFDRVNPLQFLLLLLLRLWGVCVRVCVSMCLCFNQLGRGYQGKHATHVFPFSTVLLTGFLSGPFNSTCQIFPGRIRYPTFSCFQYKLLSGCGMLKRWSSMALFEVPLFKFIKWRH